MQNFRALGVLPPNPQAPLASGGWGLGPQTPQTAPLIANFWLRACTSAVVFGARPASLPLIGLSNVAIT